ncbi:hypothetical protein BDZ97DRAFT_1662958 [Flammula alnicola]|nr:hypothetical protein BDZ97DRAFT_1662958 [Flammula alnicola]
MFKFDFDIEDAEDLENLLDVGVESNKAQESLSSGPPVLEPFSEISLQQLLDSVPQLISYSPLSIPLSSSRKTTTLVRRDLFDARFQLISEGAGDAIDAGQEQSDVTSSEPQTKSDRKALEFLDAPSDLVPGVYEGGLKTWECSLDLVDYMDGLKDTSEFQSFSGKRILELGCGTGIPSIYILREIFDSSAPNHDPSGNLPPKTEIHLQDYNDSVLQLVTLPNILLTWYTSIHADPYRYTTNDSEIAPTIDPSTPGELPITPELKAAFLSSLQSLNITLRFFSGSWNTFDPIHTIGPAGYNTLLTSETIYRTDSLDPLLNLMQAACTGKPAATLEHLVSSLKVVEEPDSAEGPRPDYMCLVAAKVLYFGVGGGVSDFLKAVESRKGRVDTVLERKAGVGRKVMHVRWS